MGFETLQGITPFSSFYDVRDQVKRHVYARSDAAFSAGDAARDAVRSVAALQRRQAWARRAFLRAVGGLPSLRTPLNARLTGVVREVGFRIEKVIFESRPRHVITANLYLPEGVTAKRGAVLFLCGHHEAAKQVDEYQIVCRTLVRAGLIVLAQDPIGQGERLSYYDPATGRPQVPWGTAEHAYAGAQCLLLGDTLGRYFLHDAIRGMDYLCARPEVEPGKIGVTGNSGGGTQTCMMMLADPRVAAAAPATFLMNRRGYLYAGGAQDAEQIVPGLTALGIDHEDYLLAMAPKPVLVLAVKYDYFPIEGTRQTVARCRRFWKLFGKERALKLLETPARHAYTPVMADEAAAFFSRCFHARPLKKTGPIRPIPAERLWCTKSGQVKGDFPDARFVLDENRARLAVLRDNREPPERRRRKALAWLKERVFFARRPCASNLRLYYEGVHEGLTVQAGLGWAQEGLFIHGLLFRLRKTDGLRLPVTLAVWKDGTAALTRHEAWIESECRAGKAVLVLDVTASGGLLPNPLNAANPRERFGVIHKLCDDLFWLGDSLAALRVFDVIRAVDLLREWPGVKAGTVDVHAADREGLYARLAAALDSRLRRVRVSGEMRSYADWVNAREYDPDGIQPLIMPGLLRRCDLPDLCRNDSAKPNRYRGGRSARNG
ncbi:MAG: hypothetical protein HY343_08170 [Lentisphaerae bacterium]|nr:hypothetical protein [Lentisphaerota bacterium]